MLMAPFKSWPYPHSFTITAKYPPQALPSVTELWGRCGRTFTGPICEISFLGCVVVLFGKSQRIILDLGE